MYLIGKRFFWYRYRVQCDWGLSKNLQVTGTFVCMSGTNLLMVTIILTGSERKMYFQTSYMYFGSLHQHRVIIYRAHDVVRV